MAANMASCASSASLSITANNPADIADGVAKLLGTTLASQLRLTH